MRILNFGSLNIDHVYRVDDFVHPGETKHSLSYQVFSGGKGLNQSIAAARAGLQVFHAGLSAKDGAFLRDELERAGVNTVLMQPSDQVSGHAIIQVSNSGQNAILLHGGANLALTEDYIDKTLDAFGDQGLVLLQNETNLVGEIIRKAAARGLQVALNAAPFSSAVLDYPLEHLTWLIVNENEAAGVLAISPEEAATAAPESLIAALHTKYSGIGILLTLGSRGSQVWQAGLLTSALSFCVQPVDTTAAGDTFTGFFLRGVLTGMPMPETLRLASAASALCIQRPGAAASIPSLAEVEAALSNNTLGELKVTCQ